MEVVGEGLLAKSRSIPSSKDVFKLPPVSDKLSSSLMSAIPDKMLSMVKALSFLRWLAKLDSLPSSPTTSISSSCRTELVKVWMSLFKVQIVERNVLTVNLELMPC